VGPYALVSDGMRILQYSGHRTFWPMKKLAGLADGPTVYHVICQGPGCLFYFVCQSEVLCGNVSFMVLLATSKYTGVEWNGEGFVSHHLCH
jgi:hypothetical protein